MIALKQLRTRFPGIDNKISECVATFAEYEHAQSGTETKRVRGWIEVRHANPSDALANFAGVDWIAYLHAKVVGGSSYRIPVVPDEFNPRPDKIVRPEDSPHVFRTMQEAEEAANHELGGFVHYIESKL